MMNNKYKQQNFNNMIKKMKKTKNIIKFVKMFRI